MKRNECEARRLNGDRNLGVNSTSKLRHAQIQIYPRDVEDLSLLRRPLMRIARRPADRFLSLFRPVHRYQCIALECGWPGNLRTRGAMTPMTAPKATAPLTTPTGTG